MMKGVMQHRKSFVEMSGDALDNDNATSGIGDVNLGFMLTYHEL